jgi:mannose-1-phosphate guanylyltransferase
MTPSEEFRGPTQPWAIVLAGGDGTRLRSVTRLVPKQFANFSGPRSLLQNTLDRIAGLIPPERTMVVVGARHGAIAREQLAGYPRIHLLEQPRNLGTAPGILFPLAHVRARAPEASVAIFPSDHHVCDPNPLLAAVRTALEVSRARGAIALIGAEALSAETEYGWIVPSIASPSVGDSCLVRQFVEKPDLGVACGLQSQGALWNTFTMAAQVTTFWEATRRQLPRMVGRFDRYARSIWRPYEPIARAALYDSLEHADFSRDVVEHTPGLIVVPVRGCGWSDLGSPRRLHAALGDVTEAFASSHAE